MEKSNPGDTGRKTFGWRSEVESPELEERDLEVKTT